MLDENADGEGEDDGKYNMEPEASGLVVVKTDLLDDAGRLLVYSGFTVPLRCRGGNFDEEGVGLPVDVEREALVQIPLYSPKHPAVPSIEDMRRLEPLLSAHRQDLHQAIRERAQSSASETGWDGGDGLSAKMLEHEAALAAQREGLDAARLVRTFADLKCQGLQTIHMRSLEPLLSDRWKKLLELVKEMQGVRVHTVLLCDYTLGQDFCDLLELPSGLRGMAGDIRGLQISSKMLYELPEWLGELVHLEKLCVSGCGVDCNELAALPDSIQHLSKLHTLELEGLYCLSSLPPSIGKLTALECLRIDNCNEDLYSSIGVLSCLTDLRLDGFGNELPACIRTWKLCRLHLNDSELTRLPVWFSELTTLQVLTLSGARLRKVPSLIGKLVGLEELEIGDSSGNITSLPLTAFKKLSNLTSLTLMFDELCKLPCSLFDNLKALNCLRLIDCRKLRGPLPLASMTSLRTLKVSFCRVLSLAPHNGQSVHLENLDICYCDQIVKELPMFWEALTALRALSLKTLTLTREINLSASIALACTLPKLVCLKSLCLPDEQDGEESDDVLMIGLALRAWPKPALQLRWGEEEPLRGTQSKKWLCGRYPELELPPEASLWDDTEILAYFALQQRKVEALACGLHRRLGAASPILRIDDHIVSLIVDEVLGRRMFDAYRISCLLCIRSGQSVDDNNRVEEDVGEDFEEEVDDDEEDDGEDFEEDEDDDADQAYTQWLLN